jgi:hypothetical protein
VTVTLVKAKLEEGSFATDWSPAPEDTDAQLNSIAGDVESLDSGMNTRVQTLIDAMAFQSGSPARRTSSRRCLTWT